MKEDGHGQARTEDGRAEDGTREAGAGQVDNASTGQAASTDPLPGEPGVDRPPTPDEIRAAEEAAVDVICELRVYAECGGPEPREHGCGAMLWLNGGQAIHAVMSGRSMIVKCKGCGMFNRLTPPSQPPQQMVQRANPEMQRRIVEQLRRGCVLGTNGKSVRS